MKKLFSIVSILVLTFTLVGCVEDTLDESVIAGLTAELEAKTEAILELEGSLEDAEDEIAILEQDIEELLALIYDSVITVTFDNGYGTFTSGTIGFDDAYNGTLLELIDESYDVQYSTSEFGAFIYGIEGITTMQGNFISFSKNGESSMVGVDTATFEDGDVISFELQWWDTGLQAVYEGIQLFLDNHAANYVNDTTVSYNVLMALEILGLTDDYITQAEMEALVDTTTLITNADYFKAIMKLQAVGSDVSQLYTDFATSATVSGYGGTAYALLALNSTTHSVDFTSFETNALTSYDTESPYDLGLDSGGITLVALSEYAGDTEVDAMITEFTTWIQNDQLPSGGIETRDMGWGSSENAASISQVIIGLVANGINPSGVDYSQGGYNLITRLLDFQHPTGSFDWTLTDAMDEDLAFSTPQAFLALVVYQQYVNTMSAVNPYSFK